MCLRRASSETIRPRGGAGAPGLDRLYTKVDSGQQSDPAYSDKLRFLRQSS